MKKEKVRQIARLLVMGHTDKVIAEQLGYKSQVSVYRARKHPAVRHYVAELQSKLDKTAVEMGLLRLINKGNISTGIHELDVILAVYKLTGPDVRRRRYSGWKK